MAKSKPNLDHIAPDLRRFAVPIAKLVVDPKNARVHDEQNLEAIRVSLLERGQTLPITVRSANGVVMTGNGTVEVATRLGWTHVAALYLDYTEEQAAAWAIAHNRTAELAAWDYRQLAETILELPDINWVEFGFDPEELEKIMAQASAAFEPDPADPGPAPAGAPPAVEWEGMPEYNQVDKTPFRTVRVHFRDAAAADEFFKLVGHPSPSERTKFTWYPFVERIVVHDKAYEDGQGEP